MESGEPARLMERTTEELGEEREELLATAGLESCVLTGGRGHVCRSILTLIAPESVCVVKSPPLHV